MLLWAQQRNTEQKHKSETRERPGRVSLSTVPLTGTGDVFSYFIQAN